MKKHLRNITALLIKGLPAVQASKGMPLPVPTPCFIWGFNGQALIYKYAPSKGCF